MSAEMFKIYKPAAFNLIKMDYGIIDDDEAMDNLFGNCLFPGLDDVTDNISPLTNGIIVKDNIVDNGINESLKTFMSQEYAKIKSDMTMSQRNIKKDLVDLFKCLVCFESRPNSYSSCHFCGRYLGCHNCIAKLSKCPICRKNFKCERCSFRLPRKALFIPSIEDVLPLPAIETTVINQDSDSDNGSGDTLPIALPSSSRQT